MSTLNHTYLYQEYVEKQRSTHEIAAELKTYPNKILRALREFGITPRGKKEAQQASLRRGRGPHPTRGTERPLPTRKAISAAVKRAWLWGGKQRAYEKITGHSKPGSLTKAEKEIRDKKARSEFIKLWHAHSETLLRVMTQLQNQGETVELLSSTLKAETAPLHETLAYLSLPDYRVMVEFEGPHCRNPIWGGEVYGATIARIQAEDKRLLNTGWRVLRLSWDGIVVGKQKIKRLARALLKAVRSLVGDKKILWSNVRELIKNAS